MSVWDHLQRKRIFTLDNADALAHATLEDAMNPEFGRGQAEVTRQFRES